MQTKEMEAPTAATILITFTWLELFSLKSISVRLIEKFQIGANIRNCQILRLSTQKNGGLFHLQKREPISTPHTHFLILHKSQPRKEISSLLKRAKLPLHVLHIIVHFPWRKLMMMTSFI